MYIYTHIYIYIWIYKTPNPKTPNPKAPTPKAAPASGSGEAAAEAEELAWRLNSRVKVISNPSPDSSTFFSSQTKGFEVSDQLEVKQKAEAKQKDLRFWSSIAGSRWTRIRALSPQH